MRQLLQKILPENDFTRKCLAIGVTVLLAGLLTLWGIYQIGEYGLALFMLTPLFIGAAPCILYGIKKEISSREAASIAFLSLLVFTLALIIFAIEGLLCVAMAAPIGLFFTWIGSLIGYAIIKNTPGNAPTAMLVLLCAIPGLAFVEKEQDIKLTTVVSSIEIDADPQTVWKNVVEFPQLEEPSEFIFKTGIAYPINAKIEGTGVGAIRHCNFTTGSFVEPITVWDEPRLLKFDVLDQPEPMKELSFWDIDAPHLHDFFVSKQGQFKLTALPNGKTLLEGTTWYHHRIKPAFYWQLWSNEIVHAIHNRVLTHIKKNSEQQ
ncbi:SRPBCC family protein [Haliscomenobacter sp.]|uniref:SRPBCC family protein n=1 Tax=Haliscomenobacter sp. TaxID=2717303 RepID=UPI003BAA4272